MRNRYDLLRTVQELGFAIYDTVLFLDTHPDNQIALDYYHAHLPLFEAAVREYEENCGPLTIHGVNSCDSWTWVETPWPWEMEA